jgi:ribonuclease HII
LAGPVVAAAVVFADERSARAVAGLADSKRLSPRERERVFELVVRYSATHAFAAVGPEEIDRLNILRASLRAMAKALSALSPRPGYALVDGIHVPSGDLLPPPTIPALGIPHGDATCLSIAAASVVAKVTRDRMMAAYDAEYPQYGFIRHKGYPSPEHRAAIARHGPCPIHRRTFRGVREYCGRRPDGDASAE